LNPLEKLPEMSSLAMKALVTLSARFGQCSDGRIYSLSHWPDYDHFRGYLEVFDEILVVARIEPALEPPLGGKPCNGPGVSFAGFPFFTGTIGFLKALPQINSVLSRAIADCQAFILRVPDYAGILAMTKIRRRGLPVALEVIGDPWSVFQPGNVEHPLLPLLRLVATSQLRVLCRKADAVSYVTQQYLQRRYPPKKDAIVMNYSDQGLASNSYVSEARIYDQKAQNLIFIGALEVMYKGADVLLKALAKCNERGVTLKVEFVGGGRSLPALQQMGKDMGLASQITWWDWLPSGKPVFDRLDRADLFVMPSKTEGLPKAMIEAMARALPCIGSNVGGIPELLPQEALFLPGDPNSLADKILEVIGDPARMTRMSARNLAAAWEYREEEVKARHKEYYLKIRHLSAERISESGLCY
jgi:glycosyltransferase involved in cell wall biosynthesis